MTTQASRLYDKCEVNGPVHWRAVDGPLRGRCPMTRGRYAAALAALRRHGLVRGARGLDSGCSDGVMLWHLERAGVQAVGLDVSRAGLDLASAEVTRRLGRTPWLVQGSGELLPFGAETFDYVVALEYIEHVTGPRRHLSELRRVLRPGGVVVLTTPRRDLRQQVSSHYHVQEFTAEELERLVNEYFTQVILHGLHEEPWARWYRHGTGVRLLDRALRQGLRLGCCFGWDPLARVGTVPGTGWHTLLAVGVRS